MIHEDDGRRAVLVHRSGCVVARFHGQMAIEVYDFMQREKLRLALEELNELLKTEEELGEREPATPEDALPETTLREAMAFGAVVRTDVPQEDESD